MFGGNAYGEVAPGQNLALWFGGPIRVSLAVQTSFKGYEGLGETGNTEGAIMYAGSTFGGATSVAPYTSLAVYAKIAIGSAANLYGVLVPLRTVVASVFGVPGFGVSSYAPLATHGVSPPLNARSMILWSTFASRLAAKSAFDVVAPITVSTSAALRVQHRMAAKATISVSTSAPLTEPSIFGVHAVVSVTPKVALTTLPEPLIRFARSKYCRSRGTRSDYYLPILRLEIGGVDRAANVWKHSLRIDSVLNEQVDTAAITTSDFDPKPGQTVIIGAGAISNRIFAGTIQRVHQRSVRNWHRRIYDIDCTDWTWSLNKRRAFVTYNAGTSISQGAADLVQRYAPTFSTARIQGGGPPLKGDMAFRGTPIMDALQQLAQASAPAWHCYPDYDKVVHFFDIEREQEQSPRPIAVGNMGYDNLDYALDLTQVQTRVIAVGGGAQTLEPVPANAYVIPIGECGWYDAIFGGVLVNGATIFHYTSVMAYLPDADGVRKPGNPVSLANYPPPQGPGILVGVTGFTQPALANTTMNVYYEANDINAQMTLAAIMGGGDDGIREGFISNGDWNLPSCQGEGQSQLNAFKNLDIRGRYHTYDKLTKVGQRIMIALPARGLNQAVTLQRVSRALAAPGKWEFTAEFAIVWADLIDVLSNALALNQEQERAPVMEMEFLGWSDASPVGEDATVPAPVYAAWCAMPITATEIQGTMCPHCGKPLALDREGGVLENLLPSTVSVSESCQACHAIVHFDSTPKELRPVRLWPSLSVTRTAKKDEED